MDDIGQLALRLDTLERNFRTHLGPAFAASSLNIPHQDTASGTDLAALDARVTVLESEVAALTTYAYTAGRYM